MIHLVHHVSGRLRLRVPAIRRNGEWSRSLASSLLAQPHVHKVKCNAAIGSVVIEYDASAIAVDEIMAQAGKFASSRSGAPVRKRLNANTNRGFEDKLAQVVATYLVEKAVERSFALLLSAIL
jgi:hypothetical protein